MWASDLTNKYLSDLAEQHKTPSESVLLTDPLLYRILGIFYKLYLEKYVG